MDVTVIVCIPHRLVDTLRMWHLIDSVVVEHCQPFCFAGDSSLCPEQGRQSGCEGLTGLDSDIDSDVDSDDDSDDDSDVDSDSESDIEELTPAAVCPWLFLGLVLLESFQSA